MNRDDIIRLAREAGFVVCGDGFYWLDETDDMKPILWFYAAAYAAGAAAEREACRDIAAKYASVEGIAQQIEKEIRARGEK